MPFASRKAAPRERGRARRHGPSGHACRPMLPGYGFSCERHFLFSLRSVNGWKEAAGNAVRQAARPPAAGSPERLCAPRSVERSRAVRTMTGPQVTVRQRTSGGLLVAGKGRHVGEATEPHLRFGIDCGAGAGRPGMTAARVPDARRPAILNLARPRRRMPCGRRTEMACRRRPDRAPGTFRRSAAGGSCVLRPGRTARGPKRHAETMVCISIRGARDGFSGYRLTRDNCRYRESNCQFSVFARQPDSRSDYYPAAPRSARPLCNLLIRRPFPASGARHRPRRRLAREKPVRTPAGEFDSR